MSSKIICHLKWSLTHKILSVLDVIKCNEDYTGIKRIRVRLDSVRRNAGNCPHKDTAQTSQMEKLPSNRC